MKAISVLRSEFEVKYVLHLILQGIQYLKNPYLLGLTLSNYQNLIC